METREQAAAQPTELPLRPQDEVECRRCGVHCDKVVYPGACVERGCPFVYSYEEFGHTYMGCLMKVFAVEIDFDLLRAAESRRGGFGAVRATAPALPMCRVEVEGCYESRGRTSSAASTPSSTSCRSASRRSAIFARIAS